MTIDLNNQEFASIRNSFYHVLFLFANNKTTPKEFTECILKWGRDLNFDENELKFLIKNPAEIIYYSPKNQIEALEQVYDLTYMVYLDDIVSDVELKIVSIFAQEAGLKPHIVGDILKAIVTAPYDNTPMNNVKTEELKEILVYN